MAGKTKPKKPKKPPYKRKTVRQGKLAPLLRVAKAEGWARYVRCENDERCVLMGAFIHMPFAKRVRSFFREFLKHSKGDFVGKPFILLPWQYHDIVVPAFGWIHPKTGKRLKREIYCEIAKKNGKSTLAAGLALYLLIADGEAGAEIYTVATKKEQAAIIYDEAVSMVKRSARLLKRLRIHKTGKVISHEAAGGKIQALPADGPGIEGANPSAVFKDEMHVWRDRVLLDALRHSGAARKQPLTFTLTTAGICDPTSVGWGEHAKAARWLEGNISDPNYHAVIYGNEESDPNYKPYTVASMKRANPSWKSIIDPDEIKAAAKAARETPRLRPAYFRYRENVWIGADSPWLDMTKWDRCGEPYDEELLYGRECYGGIDIATKLDLTALVWVFPATEDDPYIRVLTRFWVPRETATLRSARDKLKYLEWADEGYIKLFDSNVTDFSIIMTQFEEDRKNFRIVEEGIGVDPYQAEHFRQELDPQGAYILEYGQSMKDMTTPTKHVEELLASDGMRHDDNPVLRWCVSNAVVIDDDKGNIMLSKKRSADKIDGAVAMIMGLGRKLITEETPPEIEAEITVIH